MAKKRIAKFNVDGIKVKEKSLPEYLLEDNKCLDDRYYTKTELDSKVDEINTNINNMSGKTHNHDDRYYTESEIDNKVDEINTKLAGKSDTTHAHDDRYLNLSGGTLKGNIELDQGSTYSIGNENKKLKALYADEVHISQNTLYINETPVLGTESDTITVKADADQSVLMKTSGIGVSQITSEKGVDVITKGNNSSVTLTADGTNSSINLSATKNINITSENIFIDGNTTIKNLNVIGTTTTVNSTDLSVKDNIIEINTGETGNGVSKGTAGIKVNRGDELPYLIEFDEAEDMFKVGMQGDLETIASQNYVNAQINNLHDVSRTGSYNDLTDKPTTFIPSSHNHDDVYYTKNEIDALASNKSDKSTAVTHIASTAVGDATKGIYVDSNGNTKVMTYSVNKDVPSDAKFTDTTYLIATQSTDGLMSAADKMKLDEISTDNEYILPEATSSTLGGIKMSYGTSDLTAGTSELTTGALYFVYE